MVKLFGLTGPIACGKSAVASRLQEAGIPVVDADKITHRLYAEKGKMHDRVVAAFGDGVLGEDGSIDRTKLGAIVMNDQSKLHALNKATHGPIMEALLWEAFGHVVRGHRRIALDIPLLAKFSSFRKFVLAGTIVVVAPPDKQLDRLMARNGFSEEEANLRISKQASAEDQKKIADLLVDNSGTLEDLDRRMEALLKELPAGWSIYEDLMAAGALLALGFALVAGYGGGSSVFGWKLGTASLKSAL
eukprot:TRINITY_DN35718_c0_g1_i3.p1 TRINITY_DN35718_c0_g1~~TRINITY_DN35718_c0_g1_i3.p1  ORF type:complete len:246 (+),score=54.49 TRINITY_DN35718_c0_g1_i3:84-821(+)